MDTAGREEHRAGRRPDGRPTAERRWSAVVALIGTVVLTVTLVVMLLQHLGLLVGGLVGLVLVAGGGWWLVTERNPRRTVGVVAMALGVVIVALAVAGATESVVGAGVRMLALAVLAAVATGTARYALTPDLHELDRRTGQVRMRPSKPVLLCNPWSGGGKVESFGLAELAKDLGVRTVFLDRGRDLAQLAYDAIADGADCLGMAGGDGSQALVASIAIEHDLPFVCISAGTRNHFALDLGLDRDDPRTGMIAFRDGVVRQVDFATVGDRLFVNNVSLGVYAEIVQQQGYREAKRETTAQLLPELLGRHAEPFDLQFATPEGVDVDGAFLVLVSNNPYVLGPALDVSQRRSLTTGRLGVVALTAHAGREAASVVTRMSVGLARTDPNVHEFTARSFEIRSRSGKVFAGVDGESLELETPLEFAIHPRGLRVLVPPDSVHTAARRSTRGFRPGDLVDIARGHQPDVLLSLGLEEKRPDA